MTMICDNKNCVYPTSDGAKRFTIEISDDANLIQRYDPIDLCSGCENVLKAELERLHDGIKHGEQQ